MGDTSIFLLTKLVAYLAHPYVDLPHEWSNLQLNDDRVSKMYSLAKSNKVLLRIINSDNSSKFPVKSNIVAKLIKSSNMFKNSYDYAVRLQEEILDIVTEFNEQGIDTIFIKSLNALPLDSDNFDILVKETDLDASFEVLKNGGFEELVFVKEPYKWLFREVKELKTYLAFHLHTAVAWEGIKFVDVNDLLERCRKLEIDGVPVRMPSPKHHLLITTAHAFFENHRFTLNDLTYVIEDIYSSQIDWNYVKSWVVNNGWFDTFNEMLLLADYAYETLFGSTLIPKEAHKRLGDRNDMKNNDFSQTLIRRFNKKRSLPIGIPITTVGIRYVKKIAADPSRTPVEKIETILSLSKSFFGRRFPTRRKHAAFPVCFIGQDGTGKTTHAKFLWKELEKRGISAKYIWSRGTGLFFYPFLKLLRSALTDHETSNGNSKYGNVREALLTKEPLKSLWAYVVLADHLTRTMKVKLALSFGSMVICDRYILDTLVDVKYDLEKNLDCRSEGIVERLAPKPGMIFMMDTKPKELARRRPDMKLDVGERKRLAYLDYSRKRGNFHIINTCDDLQRNREKILRTLLRTFYTYCE